MSSKQRLILSIADNARIDHSNGHPRKGAHFAASERAAVSRVVARGWLVIVESSRTELYAAITDSGLRELRAARGELPTTG